MVERRFPAGAVLFSEGDPSDHAYLLRSGHVEVLKEADGGAVRLAVLGPGDVLGEMGLLEERPRSASARTLEPVVAEAIDRVEFVRLITEDPRRAIEILRALFERLRGTNELVIERAPRLGALRTPHIHLFAATPETAAAMPPDGIVVMRLPFRVGRMPKGNAEEALGFNDLHLDDRRTQAVSLNHFSIEVGPDGVFIRDRGSQRGTIVNGTSIGARSKRDTAPLHAGENVVAIGPRPLEGGEAPFRFRVVLET